MASAYGSDKIMAGAKATADSMSDSDGDMARRIRQGKV